MSVVDQAIIAEFRAGFEAKGEDAVREDIAARRYAEDRRRIAIDWLEGLARTRAAGQPNLRRRRPNGLRQEKSAAPK